MSAWRIGAIGAVLILGGCADGARVEPAGVDLLADLCAPVVLAGEGAWASSCSGRAVVNIATGAEHELRCAREDERAEVQGVLAVRSDAVVVFSCVGDGSLPTTTMVQSLALRPDEAPIDMGFPAFDLHSAAYSAGSGGSILMLAGTCDGLLAYRLAEPDSLLGVMTAVSSITIGAREFELDGGRDFGLSPPCSELAAVRGLSSSADGSVVAIALVDPSPAMSFDRPVEVFAGSAEFMESGNDLVMVGEMTTFARDLRVFSSSLGLADCADGPQIVVANEGGLSVLTADGSSPLVLQPTQEWAGVTISNDGKSLVAETEIPFQPGDLYTTNNLNLC